MRLSVIALFSIALAGSAFAQSRVQNQDGLLVLHDPDEFSRACLLVGIAASGGRVQIQCLPDVGRPSTNPRDLRAPLQADPQVAYFVTEDSALADRVIALASAATQQNKALSISYRANPAENPAACRPNNCRRLTGIVMHIR